MTPGKPMERVAGRAAAPGIAIGRAVCIASRRVEVYRFPLPEDRIEAEVERLYAAIARAEREIGSTREKAQVRLGRELASIFEAHLLVLKDRMFIDRIVGRIRGENVNAEWAVDETSTELEAEFGKLEGEYLKERREDLRDVTQHLLRALGGLAHHELSEIEGNVVIVADDLIPSEAVRLGRERVVGFALEGGGLTSHTSIIARSLHIPLVSGLEGVTGLVTDSDPVVVDGNEGHLILHPTEEVLEDYRGRQDRLEEAAHRLEVLRDLPSVTRDGVEVTLRANIDLPEEIDDAIECGARGVGLYRSEFLFIERSPRLPSEEEHVWVYRRLIERMAPDPVVIRTFDLGGRKLAREVLETHEENPVLGLRGIRLTLARPEVFEIQLRALYRAATAGDLRIMLPLVSAVEEVRQFRAMSERIFGELREEGKPFDPEVKLGIMIEVPAAALIAEQLAREVDFFSIGTNDLIQYSMAVDRGNEQVSYLYRPAHPAILRMVRSTVEGAEAAGIEVSLCGEMGADPLYLPLLLGLGLRNLSVTPRAVPALKQRVRDLTMESCRQLATEALRLATAEEVEGLLASLGSSG